MSRTRAVSQKRTRPEARPTDELWEQVPTLEALAAQQDVSPVDDFDELLGNFWPGDEGADDFISAIRVWHGQG